MGFIRQRQAILWLFEALTLFFRRLSELNISAEISAEVGVEMWDIDAETYLAHRHFL